MTDLLAQRRTQQPATPAAESAAVADLGVIRELAAEAGRVAVMVTDVSGALGTLSENLADQAGTSARLRSGTARIREHSSVVLSSALATRDEARATSELASASLAEVRAASEAIRGLASWVTTASGRFAALSEQVDKLVRATARIDSIARETHILALNARIEAARSGSAGAGFQVIADSVRDLANQTLSLASEITGSLVLVGDQVGVITVEGDAARSGAEKVEAATTTLDDSITTITSAVTQMDQRSCQIAESAEMSAGELAAFMDDLDGFSTGVEAASAGVAEASARSSELAELGESLLQLSAHTGVKTVDGPFVDLALEGAAAAAEQFELALAAGEITISDLFDERYVPIEGTNPLQHLTRFVELTDRVLPGIQEPLAKADPRIAFTACVDRNGYLPTHNLVYSKPQGSDPVWNAANCRNRRIFNDRAGLKAGRTASGFLLQTYRRDMGGGKFVPMKEVDAAIVVRGRHWGALRVAYRLT